MATPVPKPIEEKIRRLAASGRKLEALTAYREATGATIAQAKVFIDSLACGARLPLPASPTLSGREEGLLAQKGDRLGAIRSLRERTGCSLSEAVEALDRAAAAVPAARPPCGRDLLDAAFDLVRDGAPDAPSDLARRFPGSSPGDALEALRRARALADAAYELCEMSRDHRIGLQALIDALASEHPGFSESTYRKAHGHGMFLSR